ncbi:enoyl-CoA hydratase/isomerase family protein [Chloroflexota bacterium]
MAFVDYQRKGNIVIITLNRPDRLNAMGYEVVERIKDACKKFEEDDEARVAILTGTGRAFSAGADVKDFGKPAIVKGAHEVVVAVTKPVIAAVNGMALGGGCYLTIACDIRIAAESATFGWPEINLAIPVRPERILPQRLPSCVVMELILTGERITAQRAYEVGLINKVVPDEQLMPAAMKVAERIAGLSPWAVRLTKKAGTEALALSKEDSDKEKEVPILARSSEDHNEAVKAFAEKRKPIFKGK